MKTLLILVLAIAPLAASPLRDQLDLAAKDSDPLAQIEIIRRLIESGDKDPALREQLLILWIGEGDFDMAQRTLDGWKDAPAPVRAYGEATLLADRDNKPAEAFALLARYLKSDPSQLPLTSQAAGYLLRSGDTAMLAEFLGASAVTNKDASLLIARAKARRAIGEFAAAVADFEAASALAPSEAVIVSNRPAFERLQIAADALGPIDAALGKNRADWQALAGRAYWLLFGEASAIVPAGAAAAACPQSVTARILLARARVSSGQLTSIQASKELGVSTVGSLPPWETIERLLRCDAAVVAKPDSAAALAARAFVLNDAPEQYALGLINADAALEIDPKNTDARAERIYALVKTGSFEAAVNDLPEFEASKPPPKKLAVVFGYVADAAFQLGRLQDSLVVINRALVLQQFPNFYRQRAAIYQRLGRAEDAQLDINMAQRLSR